MGQFLSLVIESNRQNVLVESIFRDLASIKVQLDEINKYITEAESNTSIQLRDQIQQIEQHLAELHKTSKEIGNSPEKDQIQKQIEQLTASKEKIKAKLEFANQMSPSGKTLGHHNDELLARQKQQDQLLKTRQQQIQQRPAIAS